MADKQPGRFLVLGDGFIIEAGLRSVDEFQRAFFKGANNIQRQSLVEDFLADDDIAAKQGAGDVVFWSTDRTMNHFASSV